MGRSLAELVEDCRCVAIIGMEKNAGKTTVLNYLLSRRPTIVQAITSIGYDGEDTDQVTGTEKPAIYVGCGTLVATANGLLGACDFTRELLRFTDLHTPMGEVVIVRALSDGYAQIAGPSTTVQMGRLVEMLRSEGVDQIFIDGAAARKSTAAISASDACILATGAACSGDIDQLIEQTRHYVELLTLRQCSDPAIETGFASGNGECRIFADGRPVAGVDSLDDCCVEKILAYAGHRATVVFHGAVTRQVVQKLLDKARKLDWLRLVAEDGTRLLMNAEQKRELLARGASLQVMNPVNLVAVTVNPMSPAGLRLDSDELSRRLGAVISVPVFDVNSSRSTRTDSKGI